LKKVLITGFNSYVGTNLENHLMRENLEYHVETLDMRNPNWINFDFSTFDVVFHVAGIVHVKETKKNRILYYKVNRDLAIKTAQVAKDSGVKQFIFMSSMSVFNSSERRINITTLPNPQSIYGKTKLEAESGILKLQSKDFKVVILRPPMIYGYNCPGNYAALRIFLKRIRIIPIIHNIKSFIYIGNLTHFIIQVIENESTGIFHPYNTDNISTSQLAQTISEINGFKILKIKIPNIIFNVLRFKKLKKIVNSHYYDFPEDRVSFIGLKESIYRSENDRKDSV